MKKILLSTILTLSAFAQSFEHPSLYKDPNIIARGGVDVAIGGTTASLFSNPAGLTYMKKDDFQVALFKPGITVGSDSINFIKDLTDAADAPGGDTNATIETNKVIKKYLGDPVHLSINNLSSVGYANDQFSIGFGFLTSTNLNFITHSGFGTDGALETNVDVYTVGLLGVASDYFSKRIFNDERLRVGATIKIGARSNIQQNITTREIVENSDTLDTYIKDNYLKKGTGVGFDLGAMYEIEATGFEGMSPKVGLSILNIGGFSFGEAGEIPMSVNLGASMGFESAYVKDLVAGVDYIDMFNNFKEDSDFLKRLRVGGGATVWENSYTHIKANGGLYQGSLSAGVEFGLPFVTLGFSTYAEEIGASVGQKSDRRYTATFGIEW